MIARLTGLHLRDPAAVLAVSLSTTMIALLSNLGAVTILIAYFFVSRNAVPRGITVFEAALPIHGRDLVLSRVLATLVLTLPPTIAWGAAVMIRHDDGTPLAMIEAVIALTACAALAPYAAGRGVGNARLGLLALAAVSVGGGFALWRLTPMLATSLFTTVAAASLAVIWATVPAAPQLAVTRQSGRRPARREPASANITAPPQPVISRTRLGWAVARSAVGWNAFLLWTIVVVVGSIGNVFVFICLALLTVPGPIRIHTRWMMALPLSHRTRLLAIVVPSVFVTSACVALGTVGSTMGYPMSDILTSDGPSASTPGHYYASPTALSYEHWLRAPGSTPPVIVAPWGERVSADTASIFGMLRYNPFTVPEGSSPRFIAWQFERATTDVYGALLTQAEYQANVRPHRSWSYGWWLVNGAALLTLGLVFLLLAEPGYARPARGVWIWAAALPVIAFTASTIYRVHGGKVVEPLLRGALRDLAHALPSNPLIALLIAALPVFLAYMLLERQFAQSDLTLVGRPVSSGGQQR